MQLLIHTWNTCFCHQNPYTKYIPRIVHTVHTVQCPKYRNTTEHSSAMFCCGSVPLRWRHNGRDSVSNHQPLDCLLNRLFRRRSKTTSKRRVTGLCVGNSPGTGEFTAQMASNAENISIWWRHHVWPLVSLRASLDRKPDFVETILSFCLQWFINNKWALTFGK